MVYKENPNDQGPTARSDETLNGAKAPDSAFSTLDSVQPPNESNVVRPAGAGFERAPKNDSRALIALFG
jgi:hypothetical protein